ncbi:hypothetical protein ACFB49_26550 [Sphingomonas sp. DBB INV C78]
MASAGLAAARSVLRAALEAGFAFVGRVAVWVAAILILQLLLARRWAPNVRRKRLGGQGRPAIGLQINFGQYDLQSRG